MSRNEIDSIPLGSDIDTPHQAVGSWWAVEIYGATKEIHETLKTRGQRKYEYMVKNHPETMQDKQPLYIQYEQLLKSITASGGLFARAIATMSEMEATTLGDTPEVQTITYSNEDVYTPPSILEEAAEIAGFTLDTIPVPVLAATDIVRGEFVIVRRGIQKSEIWRAQKK